MRRASLANSNDGKVCNISNETARRLELSLVSNEKGKLLIFSSSRKDKVDFS